MTRAALQVTGLRFDYKGLDLRFVWFPGLTRDPGDRKALVEAVRGLNARGNPFGYGFFSPTMDESATQAFLEKSIWCLVYRDGALRGFAYNYDVGPVGGRRLIHMGLVKFYERMGRDAVKAVYNVLTLGNLLNFGPHFGSNISHVPMVIEFACHYLRRPFPHFERQDLQLRASYLPAFDLLASEYMVPLLGYDPGAIDCRTFRVREVFDVHTSGFESAWDDVPKSDELLGNLFVKEWLTTRVEADGRLHIKDDLVQIGVVDHGVLGDARNVGPFEDLRPLDPDAPLVGSREPPLMSLAS